MSAYNIVRRREDNYDFNVNDSLGKNFNSNYINKFVNANNFDKINFEYTYSNSISNANNVNNSNTGSLHKKILNVDDFIIKEEEVSNNKTLQTDSDYNNKTYFNPNKSNFNKKIKEAAKINTTNRKTSNNIGSKIIKNLKNTNTYNNSSIKGYESVNLSSNRNLNLTTPNNKKINLKEIKEEISSKELTNANTNTNRQGRVHKPIDEAEVQLESLRKDFFNQLISSRHKAVNYFHNEITENIEMEENILNEGKNNTRVFDNEQLTTTNVVQIMIHPSEEDILIDFFRTRIPKIIEDLQALTSNIYTNKEKEKEFIKNKYSRILKEN